MILHIPLDSIFVFFTSDALVVETKDNDENLDTKSIKSIITLLIIANPLGSLLFINGQPIDIHPHPG